MILTIALNPTVNRYIELNKFNINGVSYSKSDILTIGDCGVYSAYIMKLLQGDPYVMGVSGGIGGRFVKNFLDKNRIKSDFLQVDRETRTSLIIQDGINEKSTIVSHNDGLSRRDYTNIRHKLFHHLDDAELITVTGDDYYTVDIINDIHEMTRGTIRILLGAQKEALKAGISGSVYGLVLNSDDLDELGLPQIDSHEAITEIIKFQKRHKIKYVIVENPSYVYGFIRHKVCRVPWNLTHDSKAISKSLLLGGLAISIKRKYPFERMIKILGAIASECQLKEYPLVTKRKDVERKIKYMRLHEIYNLRNGFLIGENEFE